MTRIRNQDQDQVAHENSQTPAKHLIKSFPPLFSGKPTACRVSQEKSHTKERILEKTPPGKYPVLEVMSKLLDDSDKPQPKHSKKLKRRNKPKKIFLTRIDFFSYETTEKDSDGPIETDSELKKAQEELVRLTRLEAELEEHVSVKKEKEQELLTKLHFLSESLLRHEEKLNRAKAACNSWSELRQIFFEHMEGRQIKLRSTLEEAFQREQLAIQTLHLSEEALSYSISQKEDRVQHVIGLKEQINTLNTQETKLRNLLERLNEEQERQAKELAMLDIKEKNTSEELANLGEEILALQKETLHSATTATVKLSTCWDEAYSLEAALLTVVKTACDEVEVLQSSYHQLVDLIAQLSDKLEGWKQAQTNCEAQFKASVEWEDEKKQALNNVQQRQTEIQNKLTQLTEQERTLTYKIEEEAKLEITIKRQKVLNLRLLLIYRNNYFNSLKGGT